MRISRFGYAVSIGAAALFAGCGGSQPPIGAPGAMPQVPATAAYADRGTLCFDCAQHDITALKVISAKRAHVSVAYSELYSFKGGGGDG